MSKKRIFFLVLIIVVGLVLFNFDLIRYSLSQAAGQIEIVYSARPNEEWLANSDYPDSLKAKIRLIEEVKIFAFDSLGINYSENYSAMYEQKGEDIMFVVSACKPFEFDQQKFVFPIIGSFSYKGFFDREMAEKEKTKLKDQGLDSSIRTAGGWSTLGWFKDPILSKMLDRNEGYLAETIIHELTHGTLFVKDSLKFNENLATFVGTHGARLFLKNKFGENSIEYVEYLDHWTDRRKYVNHILRGALYLDSIYSSFTDDMGYEEKNQIKTDAIQLVLSSLDTLNLVNYEGFLKKLREREINNTYFMSYVRYNGEIEKLEEELKNKYQGNIKRLLEDYKEKYPSL